MLETDLDLRRHLLKYSGVRVIVPVIGLNV